MWSGDWQRNNCQLVDWLSYPGPPTAPDGTQLRKGSKVRGVGKVRREDPSIAKETAILSSLVVTGSCTFKK